MTNPQISLIRETLPALPMQRSRGVGRARGSAGSPNDGIHFMTAPVLHCQSLAL